MNRRGWAVVLFMLTAAAYALAGWRAVLAHHDPAEMDTVAYLDAALQIRQSGGILHQIPNMITGVYREATQHPLYLMLISPFAEHHVRAFVAAKLGRFGIGFFFLAVYFTAVRRLFGTAAAGAAGWLWIMSAGFLTLVTTVACEGLLGVFFIGFWFCTAAGSERKSWWLAAGACAALAYWTKSIGILTLPVFVLCAAWTFRKDVKKLFACREFWGFFGIFVLISLPIFIRNAVVYGSPLYSDSSGVLWIDRWDEFSFERAAEGRFTLANYLKTHSPLEILRIMAEGLFRRDVMMIVDGLKPLPFWRAFDPDILQGFYERTTRWQEVWAGLVAVLAGAGWWANRRHAAAVPTLALWAVFAVFVGWYSKVFPTTPPTRLLYPVLILVPVYAALGVKALVGLGLNKLPGGGVTAGRSGWGAPAAAGLLAVTILGLAAHGAGSWMKQDISKSYRFAPVFGVQTVWAETRVKAGEKVLIGDLFLNYHFYFKGRTRADYVVWPKFDDMDDAAAWVRAQNIRYVILDLATVLYNPQVFGNYYRIAKPGLLRPIKALPDVFKPIPRDAKIPAVYETYEVVPAASAVEGPK